MKYILFFLIILMLFACSVRIGKEHLVYSKGDKKLKSRLDSEDNYFIGISQPDSSEFSALENAKQNCILKIMESLGVNAVYTGILETNTHIIDGEEITQIKKKQKLILTSEADIILKNSKSYIEKWAIKTQNEEKYYYLAKIGINFDEKEYLLFWKHYLIERNTYLEKWLENISSTNNFLPFLNSQNMINQMINEIPDVPKIKNLREFENFETMKLRWEILWKQAIKDINVKITNREFDQTILRVSYKDKPIRNQTILLKTEYGLLNSTTDNFGYFFYPDIIQKDLEVDFLLSDVELDPKLWRKDYKIINPFGRGNVEIFIQEKSQFNSRIMKDIFSKKLVELGYKVAYSNKSKTDVTIEISSKITDADPVPPLPDRRVVKSKYIIRFTNKHTNFTYDFFIPNPSHQDTRGFGRTFEEAVTNSLLLTNLEQKDYMLDQMIFKIDQMIQQYLIDKW